MKLRQALEQSVRRPGSLKVHLEVVVLELLEVAAGVVVRARSSSPAGADVKPTLELNIGQAAGSTSSSRPDELVLWLDLGRL